MLESSTGALGFRRMRFPKGSIVWVEDKEHAWVEGKVLDYNNGTAVVETPQGNMVTLSSAKLLSRDPEADHGGVDDMTKLVYLNEPGVLYNLSRRYALNEIYTYTGRILIAVNPFTNLPHLYNQHMMDQYKGVEFGDLSPHVFAIADAAYRAMMNQAHCQSILVSGESGAGKTETTKLIMQYLTYVGGRASSDVRSVEQQVLESNPLLEAFGNARTVKNDNSSRFGKFVEIQFDGSGRLSGAAIRTYLLERSRVVQIIDPERNYHCFYQLCASRKDAEKYRLGHPSNFHYLNQSKTYELDGRDDAGEYLKTRRAMDIVGISLDDQEAIFRTLAAILHLGNIEFSPGKENDSSTVKDERSTFHLHMAADLFKCDENLLVSTFCYRLIKTHDGSIVKAVDCDSAAASRDVLSKTVYARLFDWLVEKINMSVGQDKHSRLIIGLLDIYGFECFKINSFEQFCINYANEKLQQHFNQHVFKMEQEEYKNERISWSYIDFIDNQDVLDLIEKKPIGIISLLDEACMFPRATHETFALKLFQRFPAHQRLEKAKFSKSDFTLYHYAGKVPYKTSSFLDKNRDYVVPEHMGLISSSKCSFISGLFSSEELSRSSYKFSSVASRFKQQLQELMVKLNATEPHYVRCIKPNSSNCSQKFDCKSVLHQLRCGGVLEAVRISVAGFPTRRTYSEFIDRFGILVSEYMDRGLDEKALTEKVIQKLELKNFQLGKTKVFLRAGQIAVLDARRNKILDKAAKLIQYRYLSFFTHSLFISKRLAAITLQSFCHGCLARNQYAMRRECSAATLIQKYTRSWLLRCAFLRLHSAILIIQSSIRAFWSIKIFLHLKENKAAVLIQAQWKMFKSLLTLQKYRWSATFIQCSWRQKVARRELQRLQLTANEAGSLREAKSKLEMKLEDLIFRLTLEKKLRIASDESKTMEVSKRQNALEILNADLERTKLACINYQNKNETLQEQLDVVLKENTNFHAKLAKLEELEKENLFLMSSLEFLTKKSLQTEQELLTTRKCSHATSDMLKDLEAKFLELQQNLHLLEVKLVSLEDENHQLRQKALNLSPRKSLSEALKPNPENHTVASVSSNTNQMLKMEVPMPSKLTHLLPRSLYDLRKSRMVLESHEEYRELIQKCIKEDLGFRDGKPVASCIIYKCLVHWHAFEAEKTDVFEYVIEAVNNVVKEDNENFTLPYWLSNASVLLCLLLRNLRSSGIFISQYSHYSESMGFNGRFGQGPKPHGKIIEGDHGLYLDARYPAMLFKQKLTACLEKIFGLIRDNLKKEISPLLNLCIQAPKATRGSPARTIKSPGGTMAQQPLSNHWDRIIKFLDSLMGRLEKNYVPSFFIRKLITQVFSFINIQLFNSLLLRRECCTFSNGEYVKSGLLILEKWIVDATEEYAGTSWDELNYIRQAVEFLVIPQKRKKSLDVITQELCPALSIRQIYRICTMYWDDKYDTHSVSNEVVATMRSMVNNGSHNLASNSFLLDDDLSIPFTAEDISKALPSVDPSDIQLPPSLHQYPAAAFFLHPELSQA